MNNSRLAYSTEAGRICSSCQKPVSACTCKKKKPRSQTTIKYDGIIRVQPEVKGRNGNFHNNRLVLSPRLEKWMFLFNHKNMMQKEKEFEKHIRKSVLGVKWIFRNEL